jgi:putative membrane protein
MYWHGLGWSFVPFLFMAFFWVAVIVVAIVLIVKLAGGGSSKHASRQGDAAEDVLRQRYARGEISKEQFDQMLSDLRK